MKKKKCNCPIYCKFCGAKLGKDYIGHFCQTANCQWQFGVDDCIGNIEKRRLRSDKNEKK